MSVAIQPTDELEAGSAPAGAASAVRRVLHVVLSLNPGGTERLVVALAQRLASTTPTAVCCLDDVGTWGEELRRAGLPVTSLGRAQGFHPGLGRRIARIAREHRADVLHCHHYSPFVYAALSKAFYGTPRLLFTEHGRLADAPPSSKRRWANAILARMPDAVFAVSDDLKRHLVREGFRADRVRVLHNGIDPGPRPTRWDRVAARGVLGIPEDACVAATVARLDPVKGLGTLLEGFARFHAQRPHATLLIVGDGPDRDPLERLARTLDVSASVIFAGHRDDARRLLAGADIYVNSSSFEGISLTVLEAMAACLPVIATRVGGNPEILDAESGVLVPSGDPAALASALDALAASPARRAELGAGARHRVEREFSLDRMIAAYAAIYRDA